MDLFWELRQSRTIKDAEASADRAESKAEKATEALSQLKELERQVEKLTLVNMALVSLMKQKLGVTDEQLLKEIERIDLLDGKLDGKAGARPAPPCAKCQRPMTSKHPRCLYCGTAPDPKATYGLTP